MPGMGIDTPHTVTLPPWHVGGMGMSDFAGIAVNKKAVATSKHA
jgi:hypothetical protein